MHHLTQLPAGDLALLRFGHFVDKPGVLDGVTRAEEHEAFARQSIAARATGFLVKPFDVLRHIVMNDEADIRLIDAHAESNRRANHLHVIAQEHFLIL